MISCHLIYLNNIPDKFSKSYENLVFMGDFSVTMDDKSMIDFTENQHATKTLQTNMHWLNTYKQTQLLST